MAKSENFCGTGEVEEKKRGGNKSKGEKTDANCEILMGKLENLIVTILSLLLQLSMHAFLFEYILGQDGWLLGMHYILHK